MDWVASLSGRECVGASPHTRRCDTGDIDLLGLQILVPEERLRDISMAGQHSIQQCVMVFNVGDLTCPSVR